MSERVVVVGAGMVGHRFVDELVRADVEQRFTVTQVGAEAHPTYNRILLSDVLADRVDPAALGLPASPERADVRHGHPAVGVDRVARAVRLTDGSELGYDRLVLATGARAVVPPVPGLLGRSLRHVHVLRDLDDCAAITARALTAKSAVVLGGGVLGLEVACGLRRRDVPVTVVDVDEHLMSRQLPAEPAGVLASQLRDLGVDVRTGQGAAEVIGVEGELVAVRLTDGTLLACDLMVVSCGVQPAKELAEGAGLPTQRGVLVDEHLATADPDVFAIGDCAEPPGGGSGLLAPGWRQAEALADGFIRGVPAEVRVPEREAVRLKAAGASLATDGVRDRGRVVTVHDPTGRRHVELVVDGQRLVGYTCVGAPDVAAGLAVAHDRSTPVPDDPLSLLVAPVQVERATPVAMPGSTTVCRCNDVSKQDVVRAWENGATTVESVAGITRATTGCGGCADVVCGLVEWLNDCAPAESGSGNTRVTQRSTRVTSAS